LHTYICTHSWHHVVMGQQWKNGSSFQEESTLHTSLQIENMRGLDYGSGMAYNFFYGYLRLVLPEGGTQGAKGLPIFFF